MAVDYGQKRIGISVTDPLQIIAQGLTTVETKSIFVFLADYLKKESVCTIVVGYAKNANNTDAESMQYIKPFVEKLKNVYPNISIEYEDERYTSKLAVRTMIDAGVKKMDRRNKALIDQVSSTIILQSYMERMSNLKKYL